MAKQEENVQTYKGITDAQIKEWKAAHPMGIKDVFFPDDEDDLSDDAPGAGFIITPPSRKVIKAITKYAADKQYDKVNEVLIKNCVLGGDMDKLENEDETEIYLGLLDEIGKLTKKKKARVKKR